MPTDAPSVVRTFRLPAQTLAKLDAIAQRTGRTRASMLADLITIAEPTGFPDVRLRGEQTFTTAAARAGHD